jgi:gamma-glutamyltranspeptidase/glutathione hydrolase
MLRSLLFVALLVTVLPLHGRQSPESAPRQAAIASANAYATDAGLEVLAAGGNAFDAAVAVSATLGLVEPESSGIGGGGLMLLHIAGGNQEGGDRQVFIDARERAPLAAHRDMYLDADGKVKPKASMDGPLAAAIPGLPAGLVHMSQKYGRLPLKDSLAPAIRLARNGWTMNHKTAALLPWRGKALRLSPGAMELFFRNGEPIKAGETLKNPAYARTLELIAKQGHDGFYRGELAKKLVRVYVAPVASGARKTWPSITWWSVSLCVSATAGSSSSPRRRRLQVALRWRKSSTFWTATNTHPSRQLIACTSRWKPCAAPTETGRSIWVILTSRRFPLGC